MRLFVNSRSSAAGDAERFEAIFERHHAAVLGYALRRSASPDDAADALAETFATAWRRFDEAPAGDAVRWWLYAIAGNAIRNAGRSARRRDALACALANELTTALQRSSVEADTLPDDLTAALARLSDDEREVLLLHAWEDLKPREIAAVLGIARATARTRLHRARRAFAAALGGAATPRTSGEPVVIASEELS
jgi:RNA polymerase sigma-70 factor (ECF subfamily)